VDINPHYEGILGDDYIPENPLQIAMKAIRKGLVFSCNELFERRTHILIPLVQILGFRNFKMSKEVCVCVCVCV